MLYNFRKFIIKVEKKFNISLYFFFPLRLYLVILELISLKKKKSLTKFSNYFLKLDAIKNKNIIVVSAGIADDISFEEKVLRKFEVKQMILIDPTEISKNFLKKKDEFTFENFALYTDNKERKIFYRTDSINLSLDNIFNTKSYYNIKCLTLNDIMKKYMISKIDILKLDIEGVADKVISKAISDKIQIDQICFELERPLNLLKQYNFFVRYFNLINLLKKNKYILYNCSTTKLGLRSEILAVKMYE